MYLVLLQMPKIQQQTKQMATLEELPAVGYMGQAGAWGLAGFHVLTSVLFLLESWRVRAGGPYPTPTGKRVPERKLTQRPGALCLISWLWRANF